MSASALESMRASANSYIEKKKFGLRDESDESDEEVFYDMSPNTRRRAKSVTEKEKVSEKLGPFGTFMSLFKAFVVTGILFLPSSFKAGGWAFQTMMLFISAMLTTYCAFLLLEVKKKTGKSAYSELGGELYGCIGRVSVDITVACS